MRVRFHGGTPPHQCRSNLRPKNDRPTGSGTGWHSNSPGPARSARRRDRAGRAPGPRAGAAQPRRDRAALLERRNAVQHVIAIDRSDRGDVAIVATAGSRRRCSCRCAGAEAASDHPDRLAVEKGDDVLDDLRVGAAVVLVGHVADMRASGSRSARCAAGGRSAAAPCRRRRTRHRRAGPPSARRSSRRCRQIGPREVLTRIALGFISPISRAPTRPRLRGLSTRCTERMSERRNSSSFSTRSTPCAGGLLGGQVLAPGDRLHAEGEPDPRDRAAEPAEAEEADRLAGDAMADPGLPAALAHKGWSSAMRRAAPRIRPQASSAVSSLPPPGPPVPHTVTPWSFSAAMSNEALRMPVVISSFSLGRRSTT